MFFNSTPSTSNKRENNYTSNTANSSNTFQLATPAQQIYSHDNPHFMTAASGNPSSSNNPNSSVTNNGPSCGTVSRTYKTREKLYYETDYVKSPLSPLTTSSTVTAGSTSALFEPFVRKSANEDSARLSSEDLPPTASIHEFITGNSGNSSTGGQSSNANNNNGTSFGSPMVINGVIGASPMKMGSGSLRDDSSVFVVGAGLQQMTRSVTVFGFPPNCRNDILLSFQGHGSIESFDVSSNGAELMGSDGSNWIHIVYESEWAAQKALSRNGSIFQPAGVMIGVIPMQVALEKVNMAADSFMSPLKTSKLQPSKLGAEEPIFLSQSAQKNAPSQASKVNLEALPDDSSIVTKAVNYIFGW